LPVRVDFASSANVNILPLTHLNAAANFDLNPCISFWRGSFDPQFAAWYGDNWLSANVTIGLWSKFCGLIRAVLHERIAYLAAYFITMPGLLFYTNPDADRLEKALASLPVMEEYTLQRIVQNDLLFLGFYAYASYPVMVIEAAGALILLEGKVYNQTEKQLKTRLETMAASQNGSDSSLEQWVRSLDGEFVGVICYPETGKVLVFNDALGRLPLYAGELSGKIVISRDVSFIKALMHNSHPDKAAVALTLLLGYAPGGKTLWEAIRRLEPATVFRIDPGKHNPYQKSSFAIDFSHSEIRLADQQDHIFHLLEKGLSDRLNAGSNVGLSLSGGLDSRLLAGMLARMDREIPTLTYADAEATAVADLAAVDQIVSQLQIEKNHERLQLSLPDEMQFDKLNGLKQGLNYLGMAFILPFLDRFRQRDLWQLTGDGGDKLLADLRPLRKLHTHHQLIEYLLRNHTIMPLSLVAEMSGFSKEDLRDLLLQMLQSYEVTNENERYMSFLIRERAMTWLFEGEDRNRCYAWSTTPYYSPDLFKACLHYPMEGKRNGNLFLAFFERLPGKLQHISNPNWQCSPADQQAVNRVFRRQMLRAAMPVPLLKLLAKNRDTMTLSCFPYAAQLQQLMSEDHLLSDTIHFRNLRSGEPLTTEAWWHLFTLLKAFSDR